MSLIGGTLAIVDGREDRMDAKAQDASGKARGFVALGERIVHLSEIAVVAAAGLLVIVSVAVAAVILYWLFLARLGHAVFSVETLDDLQAAVERVFAGVLLLLLGLELLKCLTTFFTSFQVQVEIILIVAMIAAARHIMLIDIGHADWRTLIGSAALILGLAGSYALVRLRAGPKAEAGAH